MLVGMDIATIAACVGAGAGVASLAVSLFAKRDSKQANEIAERSKQLSAESNALARESNSIAVGARQLAEEANAISLRAEQRDTEINDVVWNYKWVKPGTCKFTNSGEDEALSVTIGLSVDGDYVQSDRCNVPAGSSVLLTHPRLTKKLTDRRRELDAEKRALEARKASARSPLEAVTAEFGVPELPYRADVRIDVEWFTGLGQKRERSFEDLGTDLEY